MKVWISKYALSRGVYAEEVEEMGDDFVRAGSWSWFNKKQWHQTQDEAIKRAEEMRIAKLASLRKQIAKVEKIDFAKGVK